MSMSAGIFTETSLLAAELSQWSDWAYTLCLTRQSPFKENIEKLSIGDRVEFVREADNEKDTNAIIVHADVGDVGYLAGGTAEVLAPLLDKQLIDYCAEVAELVPFSKLDNKRKNPIVRLFIEIEDRMGVGEEDESDIFKSNMITLDFTGLFGGGPEVMTFEEKLDAARSGDIIAIMNLAEDYLRGTDEVKQDAEQSVFWMEKAAEAGISEAQYNLGLCYAKGFGVVRDLEKAAFWMHRDADNGDGDAVAFAGVLKSAIKAVPDAEAGDPAAQAILAGLYMKLGKSLNEAGPGEDFELAVKWANAASEQGDPDGMYTLALAYEHGRSVERNMAKAAELYRKAAEVGHAPSQWNLASLYYRGEGVERDVDQFIKWAELSASQAYDLAVRGLSRGYETGDLYTPDVEKKIFEIYERACENDSNNAELQHELALKYLDEDDNGNVINLDRAIYWFKKAADNGDEICSSQYSIWSFVKKLMAEGVLPEGSTAGEYLNYIFENDLEEEAENYNP